MDTQLNYPEIVKRILREYVDYYTEDSTHPLRLLVDDEHKSYMLLDIGWYGHEYIHHTPIHVDIIDGKIWVQYDDSEEGIATDLLAAGVPWHDIVLGFRPPELRQYTEFAVS
jgi:hypothetical protein